MGFYSMLLQRHPKTGVFYYRKVVPQRLRAVIGQSEIKVSLRTKDPKEAKQRYPIEAAKVEQRLALAEKGPVTLTHQQVVALAGDWYRRKLAEDEANPGDIEGLETLLDDWKRPGRAERAEARRIAEGLLRDAGVAADTYSLERLSEQVVEHQQRLLWTLRQRAQGDYRADPYVDGLPAFEVQPKSVSVSLSGLFDRWLVQRKPPAKTEYTWRRVFNSFIASVGHDDATRVAKRDVVKWKDELVAAGKAAKTVNDRLAVVHAIFSQAVQDTKLPVNPAMGVSVAVRRVPGARRLPYSDADARVLLRAARKLSGFKRWVPWLLAYTGARIEEVCQARVTDIRCEDGIYYLDINADDPGKSLKNLRSIRRVPLHPALIDEGFLGYVATLPKDGPLFPDATPDMFGRRGGNVTKWYGRWARAQGITDKRKVAHSWRHRFKDWCRDAEVPREIHDKLTGHAGVGEGDDYGFGGSLRTLAAAIKKLPAIKL